jgi:hypothetical protein
MRDRYVKYVYVVDFNQCRVINTVEDPAYLKKRLTKKPDYYGEDHAENIMYVQANVTSPLIQLKTEELFGYDLIQNALWAGLVSGVTPQEVMKKLIDANLVREVDWQNAKGIVLGS